MVFSTRTTRSPVDTVCTEHPGIGWIAGDQPAQPLPQCSGRQRVGRLREACLEAEYIDHDGFAFNVLSMECTEKPVKSQPRLGQGPRSHNPPAINSALSHTEHISLNLLC